MLDFCGYVGNCILKKHVIDNSCGDGAFLCSIVARYCNVFLNANCKKDILANELETFIHGIELDNVAFCNCIDNLNRITEAYGLRRIKWDIRNTNTLKVYDFNNRMDYVIGNPPYVRVHNLGDSYEAVKSYIFASDGMTDLYLVFFEIGFKMLNDTGKLCYITPSSWLNSVAANTFRRYITMTKKLCGLIDLEHFQAFENAMTYTIISLFDNSKHDNFLNYYKYNESEQDKDFICTLTFDEIDINGDFYLSDKEDLELLRSIKSCHYPEYTVAKNGFATLADKVFVGDFPFKEMTIPVIKGSTGKWRYCFYPYDKKGKPFDKETIFANTEIANYLNIHKKELLKGKTEKQKPNWFLFGRTQALKDVYTNKISINTVIKDISTVKINDVPSGSGVYSGIYILSKIPYEKIKSIILTDEFIHYISCLKKYKSGGYYTYSTKDIQQYINYKLYSDDSKGNKLSNGKRRFPERYLEIF